MDYHTAAEKLAAGAYADGGGNVFGAFARDVRRIYENARTYNPPQNDCFKAANAAERAFEKLFATAAAADAPKADADAADGAAGTPAAPPAKKARVDADGADADGGTPGGAAAATPAGTVGQSEGLQLHVCLLYTSPSPRDS